MGNKPIGSYDPTLIVNCWQTKYKDEITQVVSELNEFMAMLDIPEKILVNFDRENYDFPNVKRLFLDFNSDSFVIEGAKPRARNLPGMLVKALNNAIVETKLDISTFDVIFGK